jgi:hypothetical protein
MMTTKKALPVKHLSARVPWHDNQWNGKTCCNVLDNSFCRILANVDSTKDPENEPNDTFITDKYAPPCISEKGTFLSPNSYTRTIEHAYAKRGNQLFSEFGPGVYHHKPYSFNAVPFLWMMKNKASQDDPHYSEKAELYELEYDPDLEQAIDEKLGFKDNIWVQHAENQKNLLDAFFDCLKPKESLIFFYCKDTPLSDPNERVIIGVAKLKTKPGPILDYTYPDGYKGHRSYIWDRCIEHTLTPTDKDGFLLPYHDVLKHTQESGDEIELRDYVAIATDYKQFSFASELVEHDTAIDSLLVIAETLRKSESLLGRSFRKELDWIDQEVSRIWDMRGAFPGMGPVLSALKIEDGNTIAWEIEKYIRQFDESIQAPTSHLGDKGLKLFNPTTQKLWKSKPVKKRDFLKTFSRCQLTNDEANYIVEKYESEVASTDDVLKNFYLLYEKTRHALNGLNFRQIDKAILPPRKIADAFPVSAPSALSDNLDNRRLRAFAVSILEEAASQGHSLLSMQDALQRMQEKALDVTFPIDMDVLTAEAENEFFQSEISLIEPGESNPHYFLKLQRLVQVKNLIRQRINVDAIIAKPHGVNKDWLAMVNSHPKFPAMDPAKPGYKEDLVARQEKAEALKILTNYRFSVLIGPAGSGKTTLLEIFESQEEIKKGGILKLAPTGKARVKLGADAKTLAQFLYIHKRYDALTGTYYANENAPKFSGARNIVVDESSMLTEEQLAALFDALGPFDRIILVGDYRQLPPIGTGRPFVDIVNRLKPAEFENSILCGPMYAELAKIMRQAESNDFRADVALSKCFSDEPQKEDIEIFQSIASGSIQSKHISLVKWYESKDFREKFDEVVRTELRLDPKDIIKAFNRAIGAKDIGEFQYFNYDFSEKIIENWQVISPVNGYGYGVKEVNKFFQTTYRKNFINLAHNAKAPGARFPNKRKIARPKGNDNIVYGDKVINLQNTRWEKWQKIRPYDKKEAALNYIANGEIGVITGEFRGKADTHSAEPNIEITFSTQPGYSYVFYPNQLGEDAAYNIELAYAITVHKSQGSGFKTVFFVLPSKGAILSRELLYTALTRQEHKIVILHQGEFRDFIRLASTEASATARRFTDLFFMPDIRQLNQKWYDAKYINISERGEPMISKNEVIIANCLFKYKDRISYAYEDKLKLSSYEKEVKPDFTIENIETGRIFYWEHLGMMTKEQYREKWEKKLSAYMEDGFVLHGNAKPSDDKVLIVTEENPNGGVDSKYFDEIVRKIILEQ